MNIEPIHDDVPAGSPTPEPMAPTPVAPQGAPSGYIAPPINYNVPTASQSAPISNVTAAPPLGTSLAASAATITEEPTPLLLPGWMGAVMKSVMAALAVVVGFDRLSGVVSGSLCSTNTSCAAVVSNVGIGIKFVTMMFLAAWLYDAVVTDTKRRYVLAVAAAGIMVLSPALASFASVKTGNFGDGRSVLYWCIFSAIFVAMSAVLVAVLFVVINAIKKRSTVFSVVAGALVCGAVFGANYGVRAVTSESLDDTIKALKAVTNQTSENATQKLGATMYTPKIVAKNYTYTGAMIDHIFESETTKYYTTVYRYGDPAGATKGSYVINQFKDIKAYNPPVDCGDTMPSVSAIPTACEKVGVSKLGCDVYKAGNTYAKGSESTLLFGTWYCKVNQTIITLAFRSDVADASLTTANVVAILDGFKK